MEWSVWVLDLKKNKKVKRNEHKANPVLASADSASTKALFFFI